MPREDLSFEGRENPPEYDKRKDENKSGREERWKMERREGKLCGKDGERAVFGLLPTNDNNQV